MISVGPTSAQVEQVVLQVGAGEGVERGERLVEQQNPRSRHQSARTATRCACPPESSRGHTRALSASPTRSSARHTGASFLPRATLEAEADIVGDAQPRQQAGLLEDDADLLVRRGDGRAVERDRPWLGASRPQIARSMVDLPQPDPPITTRISPGATFSEMQWSACTPLG